jgi:flagellin-like hook-associated protein FlgL
VISFYLESEDINMKQDQKDYKDLLEQHLQWTKEQITILDEMDHKLIEMKKIAVHATENDLNPEERFVLNKQLEQLKKEFDSLEELRKDFFH